MGNNYMNKQIYLNKDIHTYSTFLNTDEKTKHLFTWTKRELMPITPTTTFGWTVTGRAGGRFPVVKGEDLIIVVHAGGGRGLGTRG